MTLNLMKMKILRNEVIHLFLFNFVFTYLYFIMYIIYCYFFHSYVFKIEFDMLLIKIIDINYHHRIY